MDDPDVIGRKALLGWLSARVDKDLKDAPEVLWHYTTAAGLHGILTSDRLWATNTRFLNDSQEILYGVEMATRVLMEHGTSGLKPQTVRFLAGLGNADQKIIHDFLNRTLDAFVVCFCTDGDLLSQWRAYAGQDSAGGYAIGFQPSGPPPAWVQAAPGAHGFALRRVLYDPVEQEAELHGLISTLLGLLDADPTDVARQKAFAKHLVDGLVEAASWFKHPAFAEEREWRVVYIRSNDSDPLSLRHRTGRGLVIPYVELSLPRGVGNQALHLPVTTINCGPGPEPDLKARGVHSVLGSLAHLAKVRVEGSTAPLRL